MQALAAGQHGLISTAQLQRAGVGKHQRQVALADARLVAVRSGVYRLAGASATWGSHALAAVLAAGGDAVASHGTAARLWDLPHRPPGSAADPIEVTSPRGLRLEGVKSHRTVLPVSQRARHDGVALTSPERTVLDLAGPMRVEDLGRLVDESMRRRLITLPRLWVVYRDGAPLRPAGLGTLRAVLADRVPGFDPGANEWELKMDRMWDKLGLPPAVRQYSIRVARRVYRPDRAIVELKIAVDWNGYAPHGERSISDYDSDRRGNLSAAGWWPLDFTSKSTPQHICEVVTSVAALRRRELGL